MTSGLIYSPPDTFFSGEAPARATAGPPWSDLRKDLMARLPLSRRAPLAVLLAALLTAPAVLAAPRPPRTEDREPGLIAAVASGLRAQLWSVLRLVWEKEGCGIDPHGNCVKSTATDAVTQGDEGCGLDPHGECGH